MKNILIYNKTNKANIANKSNVQLIIGNWVIGFIGLLVYYICMAIFGLVGGNKKGKGGKKTAPAKINKSAKKKAKTCEFC